MAYTEPFNDRIGYFSQAVFYKTAIGDGEPLTTTIADHLFLNGVQSINVDRQISQEKVPEFGQMTQDKLKYGKTKYQIEITRVLGSLKDNFEYGAGPSSGGEGPVVGEYGLGNGDFFYNTTDQTTYETAHVTNVDWGIGVGNGKLRYYDITHVYGKDGVEDINSVFPPDPASTTGECRTITYRNAILNSLSYSIGVTGSITETISLTSEYYEQDLVTDPLLFEDLDPDLSLDAVPLPRTARTLSRKDLILNPDIVPHDPASSGLELSWLPLEVQELFYLGNEESGIPILGITSININIEFSYNELSSYGQWSGSDVYSDLDAQTAENPDEGGETRINDFKILQFPVAVSCTFEGVVRDHFINSNMQVLPKTIGPNTYPSAIQPPIDKFDHLVTDTHFSSYGIANTGSDLYAYYAKQFQGNNKADREIRILAKDPVIDTPTYWQWNLGLKNFLTDFSVSDGDAGGGNVTASLSYRNDSSEIFLVKDSTIHEFLPADTY
jgi:hypothetical protein